MLLLLIILLFFYDIAFLGLFICQGLNPLHPCWDKADFSVFNPWIINLRHFLLYKL